MELAQAMRQRLCNHPDVERLMLELAAQLDTVKGKLYLTGKEVPYDEERALYWLNQSADQGNQYAQFPWIIWTRTVRPLSCWR